MDSRLEPTFIGYENGKPYDVALRAEESVEDMVRFVARVLEHSISEVYRLGIVEFFRDFMRASEIVEKRKANAEKHAKRTN